MQLKSIIGIGGRNPGIVTILVHENEIFFKIRILKFNDTLLTVVFDPSSMIPQLASTWRTKLM
jgi:hypothetical protein